jgi:hypothetical protein
MNQHPIERQSSDTFGRNTKADLELLRRIKEQNDDRSDEIFALAAVTAAILCVCGIAGVVAYAIWS